MKSRRSIRQGLLRHLSWLALIPAIGVAVALSAVLFPAIYEDIANENRAFGDAVVAEAGLLLQDPARELAMIAAGLQESPAAGRAQELLRSAMFGNTSFEALYLADADDRIAVVSLPESSGSRAHEQELTGVDVSGWAHIHAARAEGKAVWSDTHLSALSGKITVAVAVPSGPRVLVGEIGLSRLSEFAQRVGSSGHVMVVVVDRRGQVVAFPDPAAGLQQVNLSNLGLIRDARIGSREPQRFRIEGKTYLGTAALIAGPDWVTIVGQPVDHSEMQILRTVVVMVLAVLIISALSWMIAARLARRLTAPLGNLVAHAERVSHGDYEVSAPDMPWQELERLSEAMQNMVHSIVLRERALLTTEHRYRSLVEGMDDLIAQFDLEARIQFCNSACEQFFGQTAGACLGLSLYSLLHPDDREHARQAITQWIDSEAWQLSLENRIAASDGAAKRALWSFSKEFDADGNLTGFRGIARDVTATRRGQDALRGLVAATARESGEEFFRSLVRHMARTLDVEHVFVAERAADGASMQTLAVWSTNRFHDNFSYAIAGTPCERLLKSDRGLLAERLEGESCIDALAPDLPGRSFLGAAMRDSHGNGIGTLIAVSGHDLSEQVEFMQLISIFADRAAMELTRQHSEAELRLAASVFANSAEGILITDAEHRIISVNAATLPITGYAAHELVGNTPHLLRSGRHGPEFYEEFNARLESDGQWTGEVWNRRKDGSVYPQWMTVTAVRDAHGRVENYISSFFDISARKEAEARIHFLAHHDALTGLPNRVLLQDRINQALSIARRRKTGVGVLFLDLDRFKLINDSLGHDFGDALLEQVARRLTNCLREGETVARLGGDEFVVVLPQLAQSQDASLVAGRLLGAIAQPVEIKGLSFHVTPSIGISTFPDDGDSVETLLRNADTAMYHAKEQGRNNFQFYTEALNTVVTERVQLENDMRRGLEQHEFVVHYQPQVDARSGRVTGAEALVRWQHPVHGMISPARFIPVAEDTGLIVQLGEFVLLEACRQAVSWNRRLDTPIRMGVNLSARQFAMSNLLSTVTWAIEASGIEPESLELEITESMLMENPDDAAKLLNRISQLGVRLAIDDFGTGYSSLAYLRRFSIDRLKVDQSFIQDLLSDPNDAAIVRAVINLAHTLNLEVIAEGVETIEHLERLHEWGCFDIQGFLFSRPLSAPDFEAFCAATAADRIKTG